MSELLNGVVLMLKDNKVLLLCNNRSYILRGTYDVGQKIQFDPEDALQKPSYLFAIAAMEEENLDDTLDFIQSKWFNK